MFDHELDGGSSVIRIQPGSAFLKGAVRGTIPQQKFTMTAFKN
jgi:hypothetical protein